MASSFISTSQFTENNSTYHTITVEFKGNQYVITVACGRFSYVNVCKITNNPFRGLGKDFESFELAAAHYNSQEMKSHLLMAEQYCKENSIALPAPKQN